MWEKERYKNLSIENLGKCTELYPLRSRSQSCRQFLSGITTGRFADIPDFRISQLTLMLKTLMLSWQRQSQKVEKANFAQI